MIDYLLNRNRDVIRQSLKEVKAMDVEADADMVDDVLDYFERRTDHYQIREKMKSRFGIGVKKTDGETGYETYSREGFKEQVEAGSYETIPSGVGNKIIISLATLFTNETQSWAWVEEGEGGTVAKNDEVAQVIQQHRLAGGFEVSMADADFISVAIDSAPILLSWSAGHMTYRPFSPACLYAKYHDTIFDGGEERGVDYTDIEDASVVVIKLSSNRADSSEDPENDQYIAFFGRSDEYPYGRQVTYNAKSWDKWPLPNTSGTESVLPSGELYNPLSWLAATSDDYTGIEYPIAILRGGVTITSDTLTPISTSMYESILEVDLAYSRLMKDALSGARGKDLIKNELGAPLPRSLEGAVALQKGQSLEVTGRPAINAKFALDVINDDAVLIGSGFGVPGYMLVTDALAVPTSGIALAIRTQPLIEARSRRISLNKEQVEKVYQIERGLIEVHGDVKLPKAKQVWNPGRMNIPESEAEKINNLSMAMDKKLKSYVRAVRDYYNLPDDDAAVEMIEKITEQNAENPPPAAQRVALPTGTLTRAQRPPVGNE
jgi:hypothetical protein